MMAKHWTKIKSDVVQSERMAALLDLNPLAYALYMNAKAVCDHFGRLPGTARKFAALACPMSRSISIEDIEQALADMASVRSSEGEPLVRFYTVGADTYMEIVGYNEIDATEWRNVGLPEYPHPDGWVPPASLLVFIAEATDGQRDRKSRIRPERYGLTEAEFARHLADYRATVGRRSGDSPATVAGASKAEAEAKTERQRIPAPVGAAPGQPPLYDDPPPPPPKPPKQETPVQLAIRAAWAAAGQDGTPAGAGYPGLVKLIQT